MVKNESKEKERNLNIVLHLNIYILICFILGMEIDMAKLCSLMPVSMSLIFIQGHSCLRNQ